MRALTQVPATRPKRARDFADDPMRQSERAIRQARQSYVMMAREFKRLAQADTSYTH